LKITQLDIRDFGVFQGEKLEALGNGIIVIGGANRSGKTSLMQILRNIPFGFSQNSNLPPAKFKYDVRCEFQLENGDGVNVLLKGFSNPEVVYKNATDNYPTKVIYDIDRVTYKELFTISLDELNKSSNKEDGSLQSILLGAGFKHIVKIPVIAKELREKANAIGGTRGNPYTKMFKPFAENIKKGEEGRKKSILMLDTFLQKKNILLRIEDTIALVEKELENTNNSIIKLEVLKHNYELNENKRNLEVELQRYSFSQEVTRKYNIEKAKALKAQYGKELEQYNKDNYEFQREASKDKLIKELLLENKTEINSFYSGLSGLKERSKNLLVIKNEYYEKTQALMGKIKKANDNWTSFNHVAEINCDEVQEDILTKDIEKFRNIEGARVEYNKRIEELKIQKEVLEKQIEPYSSIVYMKKYIYFTLFFIILGMGLFFIDKLLGCSLMIIGALGSAIYLFINYSNSKLFINRNEGIKTQISNLEVIFSKTSKELKDLNEDSKEINKIMDEYRDILKLDGRVPEEGIKDYFKVAAFLKDEIIQCNLLKKKLSSEFISLSESLKDIDRVLNRFVDFNIKNSEEINLENIQSITIDILLKVETLYRNLILGEKAERGFIKLNMVEQEILKFLEVSNSTDITSSIEDYINQGEKYISYINKQAELKVTEDKLLQGVKSQRIKKMLYDEDKKFEQVEDNNEKLLKILQELYEEYLSIEELNYDYEAFNTKAKNLVEELDTLKNEKQTLKDEIQVLNSDERLVQYEQDIREARGQLRPLAERYAVYNTAALFLEKIREKFLVNTKDKLLKGASDILSEITSGEYKNIMPMEDLMQSDFKTVLKDESIKESSKELSRGTKEQLFLAVRISRIKEIKQKLPVILDDSFVNFDIAHTKNTVKALTELSKTHQIFVLTCHATLVELINSQAQLTQYFKLDKGKFTKTSGISLIEYLKEL
jgi:uncharacterized protein YhaN